MIMPALVREAEPSPARAPHRGHHGRRNTSFRQCKNLRRNRYRPPSPGFLHRSGEDRQDEPSGLQLMYPCLQRMAKRAQGSRETKAKMQTSGTSSKHKNDTERETKTQRGGPMRRRNRTGTRTRTSTTSRRSIMSTTRPSARRAPRARDRFLLSQPREGIRHVNVVFEPRAGRGFLLAGAVSASSLSRIC